MPYRWDLGWSSALLLASFVFLPALALVVRRKWRQSEARQAEVMRLVRLATAEAERAEREATAAAYFCASEPAAPTVARGLIGMSYCAVCRSPTTTRCSRCKVVKYCSGKCQIIHWRQGHKNECHPPSVDHSKGQTVPDYKEGSAEVFETDYNLLEPKGQKHENSEIKQSNSAVEGAQVGENAHLSMLVAEGKSGEQSSEASSNSDLPSEILSENGNIGHKTLPSSSGRKGFSASLTVQVSSCATFSSDTSSNDNHVKTEHGQYADKNSCLSSGNLEKSLFGGFPQSSASSTATEQINLPSSSQENVNICPSDIRSSSNSKLKFIPVRAEVDCKFDASLNTDSSSFDKLVDMGHFENANESSSVGLSLKISDNSEILNTSANVKQCHEENLDTRVAETTSNDDYIAPQTCSSCDPQIVTGLHLDVAVKFSALKSFSASSSSVGAGSNDTQNLGNEKLLGVSYGGKIDEQLKSPSPPPSKDLSYSFSRGQTIPRHISLEGESFPQVSTEFVKSSGSVLNYKVPGHGTSEQITSLMRDNHSDGRSFGSGKYHHKMLFPYDVFIKLCNSEKVEMKPCGLVNLGNSCYANAALQCLSFTRPIAAYLLEGIHSKTCPKKEWCFTCAFESLLMKARLGKSPLSPIGIISHINDIGCNFSQGREEDAHEFLRHAIDAMQSACLKEAGTSACRESNQETTLIQLTFGGYLNSKVKCMRCKGKSEKRERMMDLSVEIHGDIRTLEEALARFTATEILEGENKYKCDRCNSYEQAKKQLTILEAPNVLVIALKRYQSGKFGKLNKVVRFPEYLNLAPYMSGSDDKSPVYRLYAVVVHNDVMNAAFSGHYVCYVKNMHGKWFKTDDSVVNEVDLQKVSSQGAYMLLYARCSPRAPSLLRKEIAKTGKSKQAAHLLHGSKPRSNSVFVLHDLFRKGLHRDASSDSSSVFSCSDEGSSWSGESTRDSATTEDFTESSHSSPLRFAEDGGGEDDLRCEESPRFLCSSDIRCRNLTEQCCSGRGGETNLVRSTEVNSGVLFRRPGREKTPAQTFY